MWTSSLILFLKISRSLSTVCILVQTTLTLHTCTLYYSCIHALWIFVITLKMCLLIIIRQHRDIRKEQCFGKRVSGAIGAIGASGGA